ncbi:response regulator [Paenibacillus swuensis]|uniref:response regulator n=1 Tax=Paenibacillus swuensis TaxID=1178515 RepID=UPI0008384BC7|nr:response regulator [Paenibacillus swuensis]
MYHVLLADDERLDLEGLKRLVPWESYQMSVDGAVNSGFSALDHMKNRSVDILVTDVNMPRMSGIELARAALEMNPSLKVIFVSGYEDFHYAQSALQMGACSYVLKHVDDVEFLSWALAAGCTTVIKPLRPHTKEVLAALLVRVFVFFGNAILPRQERQAMFLRVNS